MRIDGWVFAALCHWANKEGEIVCGKSGNTITLYSTDGFRVIAVVTVQPLYNPERPRAA